MSKEKILFSWSGGKDSALALHSILSEGQYEVAALLTTITKEYDRITMHGVRRELFEAQARALGIPAHPIYVQLSPTNHEYENKLSETLTTFREKGIRKTVFGDIFLEDVKAYRDALLSRLGMEGIYPIWRRDSRQLIQQFIRDEFKALLVCVNTEVLDSSFCGRPIDSTFLGSLPPNVDPCGENGEYHSFVFAGPIFRRPVPVRVGEQVLRKPFLYCDLQISGAVEA